MPNKRSFRRLAAHLLGLKREQATLLVGIDGAGGAGKTTFAGFLQENLATYFHSATILHTDDFYRPATSQRSQLEDQFLDGRIAWQEIGSQVLEPLRHDSPGRYQRYDWPTGTLVEWCEVPVGGAIVVEGVRALQGPLGSLYDFRIWIDCPRQTRLDRGIERDGEAARDRWEKVWMPAEDCYIFENKPNEQADLVVDSSGETVVDPGREFVMSPEEKGCSF